MSQTPKDVIPPSPSAKAYGAGDYAFDTPRDSSWTQALDPIVLFESWLADAGQSEPNDPNAMSLATVDSAGLPDVRMVLLKGLNNKGFVFYSNAQSAKGEEISANAVAALGFHWKSRRRQVRVRGALAQVSAAKSDTYWQSRARHSQIGAWASQQSRSVKDRETMLAEVAKYETKFEGQDVPRPPHWIGWRLTPEIIEFWQDGAFRLHDRIVFNRVDNGWTKQRLYP